jgi:hypothetical protein
MHYILGTLGALMALDVLGFLMWVASGQTPVDGFYIGALTAHLLSL